LQYTERLGDLAAKIALCLERRAVVTEEEAKAIVRQMARRMLELASSIVAPLYWPAKEADGSVTARNGTAFFLRSPEALFGVTAAHVIEGQHSWREYCEQHGPIQLRLGAKEGRSVSFEWDARCLDIDLEIDIATFMVSTQEIELINRTPYSGLWPPRAPTENAGITYAGFAGIGTRYLSANAVQFGIV
jgi:hypothetical protein